MEVIQATTGKRVSLTPNLDKIFIDPTNRGSVEYARARNAINADFRVNFKMNQPLAIKLRRQSKRVAVEALNGTVSKKMVDDEKNPGKQRPVFIVTFPDKSVANL